MSRAQVSNLGRFLPVGPQGWLVRTPGFSAREVRQLLREGAGSVRGRAVSRVLAHTSDWLPEEPDIVAFPFHYWRQLPQILLAYSRGESVEAIGQRVSLFGTAWGVEHSVEMACRRIASCLNRDPASYGLD
jgi:hypothetical protein